MEARSSVAVIGGGAAGFFGAIHAAEASPGCRVVLFEKSPRVLSKVKISGGGRCNVTHDCRDPRCLVEHYPRGRRELLGPFHTWGPTETIRWFAERGVTLKTEPDGRMFPTTDRSQTVIDCLRRAAGEAAVTVQTNTPVEEIHREGEEFVLGNRSGELGRFAGVLLASGGSPRVDQGGNALAASLGHTIEPPVPSLFTLKINHPLLADLAGLSVELGALSVAGTKPKLRSEGPVLVTHQGLSGPGVLRLSAWGARQLAAFEHRFSLQINWLPNSKEAAVQNVFAQERSRHPKRQPLANPLFEAIPRRLWSRLGEVAGAREGQTWAQTPAAVTRQWIDLLLRTELPVHGRSPNKEEFVTCGGVRLKEVDFRTMESRLVPGLYFAGEALDLDGITGGFNFQAAWTTGYLAGTALGVALEEPAQTR